MTTLICPKCRQGMPDAALDAGQCPACGFPIDGPLILDAPARRRSPALLAVLGGVVLAASGVAGYAFLRPTDTPAADRETTTPDTEALGVAAVPVAPFPRLAKPRTPDTDPVPQQPVVVPVKRDGPRPVGVVMKVDPKIAPTRHFDSPDDTATLPDLNRGDRVTLTGRLRVLRVGSVNGNSVLDASGLTAEEIEIAGDLNGDALVTLNAPGGRVTIRGYVVGSTKLTILAPAGEVVVVANSGLFAGNSTTRLTAKRLEVAGKFGGNAKVFATLTVGGSLKLTTAEEGAQLTYKKAAASDPPLTVDKGIVRGGAKVLEE